MYVYVYVFILSSMGSQEYQAWLLLHILYHLSHQESPIHMIHMMIQKLMKPPLNWDRVTQDGLEHYTKARIKKILILYH